MSSLHQNRIEYLGLQVCHILSKLQHNEVTTEKLSIFHFHSFIQAKPIWGQFCLLSLSLVVVENVSQNNPYIFNIAPSFPKSTLHFQYNCMTFNDSVIPYNVDVSCTGVTPGRSVHFSKRQLCKEFWKCSHSVRCTKY